MAMWKPVVVVSLCAFLTVSGVLAFARHPYQLRLVVPSAAQLVVGSPVQIRGENVGEVTDIEEQDGKAVVTVSVSGPDAPLREGTTTKVAWQSVLGERLVSIEPGPPGNAEIPSGALYEADSSQVEADQVLAALDAPTRERLNSLVAGLRDSTGGEEKDIQATLRAAGPSVQALGEVLASVGRDGPAIKSLVTELHQMAGGLAGRQDALRGTVDNLNRFTGAVATKEAQLAEGLGELPATLDAARTTLDKVRPAADASVPLLHDLQPGMKRLPSVASNLRPVMDDARPMVSDLRPSISALAELFRYTPGMMDSAHRTLPPLATTVHELAPVAYFLRPYTPEFIGWLSNFGSSFSNYDSQGHTWTITPILGSGDIENLPGTVPPIHVAKRPAPGSSVDQPWTDANGDGER